MCPGESTNQAPAPDLEERLRRCGDLVDALHANYEDELEIRDRLILEAIDAGNALREVARWANVSHGRVNQIVARRAAQADVG